MQVVFVYICIYLLLLVDDAVLKLMLHKEELNEYRVVAAAAAWRDVVCSRDMILMLLLLPWLPVLLLRRCRRMLLLLFARYARARF